MRSRLFALTFACDCWGTIRKRPRPMLVALTALLLLLAVAAAGCTASDADLVLTLKTTADSDARYDAATELAGRLSLPATQELTQAAQTDATARAGLAALRDAYVVLLTTPPKKNTPPDEAAAALALTVDCLAAIGDQGSIEALTGLIFAVDAQTLDARLRAVDALGSLKTEAALPPLIEAITIPDAAQFSGRIREAASAVLGTHPESAAPLVQARAEAKDKPATSSAIDDVLVAIGEPAAAPLVAGLTNEADVDWITADLLKIGVPAIPAIEDGVAGENATLSLKAFDVLLRLYPGNEPAVAPHVVSAGRVSLLIEARNESGNAGAPNKVIESVLLEIGEPAVASLVAQLGKADWSADLLAGFGDMAAPALAELLESDDAGLRRQALSSLLQMYVIDLPAAAPVLAKAELVPLLVEARSDLQYSGDLLRTIEDVLVAIGEPAVDPLVALLDKVDWADDVLAKFGADALPQLTALLESEESTLRYQALWSLLTMYSGNKELVEPVLSDQVPLLVSGRIDPGCGTDAASAIESVLFDVGQAAVAALLTKGATLLTDDAEWTDYDPARTIYDLILRFDAKTATDAIVDRVTHDSKSRLRLLFLAVKLGISGSEDRLVELLNSHGNKSMAEDFLNCGSVALSDGAKRWASNHGYTVETGGGGSHRTAWGAF